MTDKKVSVNVPQFDMQLLSAITTDMDMHNKMIAAGFDVSDKLQGIRHLLQKMTANLNWVEVEVKKLPPGRSIESMTNIEKLVLNCGADKEGLEAAFQACQLGGELTEAQLLLLSAEYGMEVFAFTDKTVIEQNVVEMVPADVARRYQVMPVMFKEKTLTVAITDPTDLDTLDSLRFILKKDVEGVLVTRHGLKTALDRYYPQPEEPIEMRDVFLEPPSEREPFIGGNRLTDGNPEP